MLRSDIMWEQMQVKSLGLFIVKIAHHKCRMCRQASLRQNTSTTLCSRTFRQLPVLGRYHLSSNMQRCTYGAYVAKIVFAISGITNRIRPDKVSSGYQTKYGSKFHQAFGVANTIFVTYTSLRI